MNKIVIASIICVVVFLLGLTTGYFLYHPNTKPTGNDQHTFHGKDTSVVFKVVHDTVLKEKLIKIPGTTTVIEGEVVVKPGVTIYVRDSLINIDTITVDKGTKVNVTRKPTNDTLGTAFVKWPDIRINVLEDKKTNNYRIQAKAVNGSGTIMDEISVPMQSVNKKSINNQLGLYGSYTLTDGSFINGNAQVGVLYNRGLGPFFVGVQGGTSIKKWIDAEIGINAGLRW